MPPPGAPPGLLWERFSQAFGLDGLDLDLEGERANPSLGAPETACCGGSTGRPTRDEPPGDYRPLVRELLAHQTLSRRTELAAARAARGRARLGQELTAAWVEEIKDRGYDVIGDLDDLVGAPPAPPYADPDQPDERQVADAALDAITALLLENAPAPGDRGAAPAELDDARDALERAYLRPSYRFRKGIVRRLEGSGFGRGLLAVYRRARGRSSRSA